MTEGGSIETVGDNKEFSVIAISDVTVYFGDNANTSANDTATNKYFDTWGTVKSYQIRSDQTVQIISINGVTMTDPITCVADKGIIEKYDVPTVFKMVIRTSVANTNIKIRVRGR